MLEFFNSVHQYTFDIFITGIDDITGNDEYNQESLDLETGTDEYYHGIMNALQTNNVALECCTGNRGRWRSRRLYELLDKKDDVFAFDIFDDITHYDLSEPDTDNDSKSFEETNFSGQQNHSISCYDAYFISQCMIFIVQCSFVKLASFNKSFVLKDSTLCKALHYFRKHFQTINNPISYHHYCNNCYLKILQYSLQICSKCRSDLTIKDNKGDFIEFPIINQLMLLFKRPGLYENLEYKFKCQEKYIDHIEDI